MKLKISLWRAIFCAVASFVAQLSLLACSASGSGASGAVAIADISRSFSSGANPVSYTAVVHAPRATSGSTIVMPSISSQTAFQYFNQGIAAAVAQGASQIVFPAGNYSILPEGGNQYHIAINGATDLTIDLQGSNLIFQGVTGGDAQGTVQGIVINAGTRVILRNFTVDYDVRIASSGTVQSESAHCGGTTHKYVLINTATYPMTDARIQQAKVFNDSTSSLWGLRANEFYCYGGGTPSPVDLQGGNAFYPCSASFDSAFPTIGHVVTARHFVYDGNAIGIYSNSQDITLSGITLYASPAMGIYVSGSPRGIAIENVDIIKNPSDATRLISLAADGLHFNQVGGDIVIENSQISFQGDDGLNIVSPITSATAVAGNVVTIANSVASAFTTLSTIGDVFGFYGPSFSSIGTGVLQSSSQAASTALTFAALSGEVSGDWMIDQSIKTKRVYISGNSFHDNRERGMMARSTGMYIGGNSFANDSGPGILLLTDGLSFNEGGFAQDVTIQGNVISSSNQTQASAGTYVIEYGALGIGVECPAGSGCANTIAPSSSIQNVSIANNVISTTAGIGILLSNIASASVSGNTVSDASSTVLQSAFGGSGTAAGSVHYTRSTGITFGSNTLTRATTNN